MQVPCPACHLSVDLFPSWVIAGNAYPSRKPEVQILCPSCGDIFPGLHGQDAVTCRSCKTRFNPQRGPAQGAKATCQHCSRSFSILDAVALTGTRPAFKLYSKLVLTQTGTKEYLPATAEDHADYRQCSARLEEETRRGLLLPTLALQHGYNTRQAMSYGFTAWRDFFNDRQLLALGWLHAAIDRIADAPSRDALLTLFSGVLEFNNMFASYKGEGTGAVRHMFSHHILKPERTPIEANVWGTPKSSGSFSNLFRSRLLRAIEYRLAPTEVNGKTDKGKVCALPFSGQVEATWPTRGRFSERAIYLSCGNSAHTGLLPQSVDLVVTDPPFFDNVHYSELADFFHAWQQLTPSDPADTSTTTRNPLEVQDSDADHFAAKLRSVFDECHRLLKDDGLLVFTYHHSRDEGWKALADAVLGAGFTVVNSQPVKAEMSVATPKSQAKEPIQLDIIIVCRKQGNTNFRRPAVKEAVESAKLKLGRLIAAGFDLSRNDRKIVLFGQLLTTLKFPEDAAQLAFHSDIQLDDIKAVKSQAKAETQALLFE